MKISNILIAVAMAVGGQAIFSLPSAAQEDDMSRGEYLARLGNCVACHSTPEGEPFAGGLKMNVPMLGNIYTTNITPDDETGIGTYTLEDFDAAMRHGITPDGKRMYPAMPYTSYAKISEEDMEALYDYFMNEVEPVNEPNKESEIEGILSWRWPLAVWNVLFHDDDRYEPDPDQSAEWNRGAYLIEGLGHCGACHTPRGLFFQEAGLDSSDGDFLAGAELDHWYASALNNNERSGLGQWSVEEVAEFLETGKNRHGTAFGTMVEVINNSTAFMTDEDLHAMAVYLKSLPAQRDEEPWEYDPAAANALAELDFSEPGADVYYQFCVSCHMYDGSGQNKYMPSLAGNPVMMDPDASSLINITLNGSLRVVADGRPEAYDMPYFRVLLDDQQIADVVSYVRKAWGNNADPVTAEEVATIREATDPSRNDDAIVLRMK